MMNQIKADVLGLPVRTLENPDTGALGCGVIAGYGVGLYDSIPETVDRLTAQKQEFIPEPRGIWIISLTRRPTGTALSGCGPFTLFYRRHGIRHSQACCVKSIIGTIAG